MSAFTDAFTFVRPNSASYTDAAGRVHVAAPNEPRFDYGAGGVAAGLLVDDGGELGQADQVRAIGGAWAALNAATVLHEWSDVHGTHATAHYSTTPLAMVNGCLAAMGHHRRIAVIPGYLRNYGGWVWALGRRWNLPTLISAGNGAAIAAGARRALIAV